MADKTPQGLGGTEDPFPKVTSKELGTKPILRLKPGSDTHARVRDYLCSRLNASERAMAAFYDRWTVNEKKVQAYIDLPDYEKLIKAMNEDGKAPGIVQVHVPYTWATISSVVTYLIHTIAGRKPMWQVSSNRNDHVQQARNMELLLQYNGDRRRMIRELFKFFQSGEIYGLGVMKCFWLTQKKMRTKTRKNKLYGFLNQVLGEQKARARELVTVFEGNDVETIDPFNFFPDWRVPMTKVATDGEFCFYRRFIGKHTALRAEKDGDLRWVSASGSMPRNSPGNSSARDVRTGGEATPGREGYGENHMSSMIQQDIGTCEIIPAELGLGESERPEKWLFIIHNKTQVVKAEPFNADHDMHPFSVIEPYGDGFGFGSLGLADLMGPMQDTVSWFINSHIHNVRTALNNMFVYDPSMIEEQDIKRPEPGKLIRLKRSAFGQDVRTIIQQLNVTDVTQRHMDDLQIVTRFADSVSAITDNVRGLQDSGGRKTATEVRTSGEAAASRLAAHTRYISSQGLTDLAEMMALNYQQNLSMEFELQVLGSDDPESLISISAETIEGDFWFPIHDGTLPLDRVALLDVWRELFGVIISDPELRQTFDTTKVFEWMAELSGAKRLGEFKLQVQPDAALAAGAEAGNMLPFGGVGAATPGVNADQGDRLAF